MLQALWACTSVVDTMCLSAHYTGAKVRVIEYNMEDFLRSCVERYKELTGVTALRRATTPFLAELSDLDFTDP